MPRGGAGAPEAARRGPRGLHRQVRRRDDGGQLQALVDAFAGPLPKLASLRNEEDISALEFRTPSGRVIKAGLSRREQRLTTPRTHEDQAPREGEPRVDEVKRLIPWIKGKYVNVVQEQHPWLQDARARGMPISAAVSGTTNRVMNMAKMFGFDDKWLQKMRLAIMGHLITIGAHSFHEIMAGADGFPGCDYTPGRDAYHRLEPLRVSTLRGIAEGGKLPDEHEA